ncbi:hypothetical protein BsWGS_00134 [Bradybaena similaris]
MFLQKAPGQLSPTPNDRANKDLSQEDNQHFSNPNNEMTEPTKIPSQQRYVSGRQPTFLQPQQWNDRANKDLFQEDNQHFSNPNNGMTEPTTVCIRKTTNISPTPTMK